VLPCAQVIKDINSYLKKLEKNMSVTVTSENLSSLISDDVALITYCNERKQQLSASPSQSFFRVYALLIVEDEKKELSIIEGTNTEPDYIGGSICAERAALSNPLARGKTVRKVIITADAAQPITPGPLCREFLTAQVAPDVQIVMAGTTGENIVSVPLGYISLTIYFDLSFAT